MKIYTFGAEDAPVLLLLPGTCCHWKSNFGAVIPLLADSFRVLCVSYDGFDETEQTEFPTMLEETEKIEAYLKTHCGGHIRAAYGCSLGGSFVGLLAARQNIHMDYGILGSSDLDQASPMAARLQTDFLLPLIYPVVRDGKFKAKFLQKRLDKRARESGDYVKAFLKMFGDARPYVTMQSCKNQFFSGQIPVLDLANVQLRILEQPRTVCFHRTYMVGVLMGDEDVPDGIRVDSQPVHLLCQPVIVVSGIDHNGRIALAVEKDICHPLPHTGDIFIDPAGVQRLEDFLAPVHPAHCFSLEFRCLF